MMRTFFSKRPHPLRKILEHDKDGQPITMEIHRAVAALLIEAAVTNGDIPPEQVSTVRSTLAKEFALDEKTLCSTIDAAAHARKLQKGIDELAEGVREAFTPEQRIHILAMAWKIALADGMCDKFEKRTLASLQFQLGLDEEHNDEARLIAEQGRL